MKSILNLLLVLGTLSVSFSAYADHTFTHQYEVTLDPGQSIQVPSHKYPITISCQDNSQALRSSCKIAKRRPGLLRDGCSKNGYVILDDQGDIIDGCFKSMQAAGVQLKAYMKLGQCIK